MLYDIVGLLRQVHCSSGYFKLFNYCSSSGMYGYFQLYSYAVYQLRRLTYFCPIS